MACGDSCLMYRMVGAVSVYINVFPVQVQVQVQVSGSRLSILYESYAIYHP